MSQSSFAILPPETLLAITNELRDEPSASANLALTGSSLLPFARAALYDTVELRTGDETEDTVHRSQKRFADAVVRNSTLGPLVRTLSIRMRKWSCGCLPRNLHNVISGGTFPRLTSLALIEVDFAQAEGLFAIVERNRGLGTLLLAHTYIRSANNSTEAHTHSVSNDGTDPHRVPLKTLVVRWPFKTWAQENGAVERMFVEKLDLTRLQVIDLALKWPDQYTTWLPAIRAASSSIVTLRLTIGPEDECIYPTEEEIKLLLELLSVPLPSMRSLHLSYFSAGNELRTYFMETVCTVLQTYPSPFPSLTELELTMTDRPHPATISKLAHRAERLEWRSVTPELTSSLARALFRTSPQRRYYPDLERVRVRIRQQTYRTPYASGDRVPIPTEAPIWKFLTLDKELTERSWPGHVLLWGITVWEPFARQAIENGVTFDIDLLWDDPHDGYTTV